MLSASLLLLAMAPQGQGSSTAPVVINEFSYDDTGSNNRVFVELYNRTNNPVDISGWTLQGVDGSSSGNAMVAIPANTVLAAGGFYVVGQMAGVPNVDLDEPLMNTVLETGPDGVVLLDGALNAIDGVVWEYARWTNAVPTWLEGVGLFGDTLNSDSNPQSASRVFDGYDNDDNGCDFRVARWSPGTSNNTAHSSPALYVNNFDDTVGSTTDGDFNYSFVPGTTVDPTAYLNPLPPSPQGGNASEWYDSSGGGNANFLSAASANDWVLECYAFLRGPAVSIMDTNDIETWAMGMGSTDSFGEPANVNNLYTYAGGTWQPGIRGVAWFQIIKQSSSELYLVDFGGGGNGFTILTGPVQILHQQWARLRLSKIGGNLVCNYGGTFGCDDGLRAEFNNVTDCPSSIFIQYRENVSTVGAHRPIVLDALRIACNQAAATANVGAGSPTIVGIPLISSAGTPHIGNLSFGFVGTNLIPSGASFTMINFGEATALGTQIPGAQPGANLHINNVGAFPVLRLNSATGTSFLSCPIPCDTALSCLPISGQIFDIDGTLAFTIPFGTSDGLTVKVGN